MFASYIKYFFITLCSFYIYEKLFFVQPNKKQQISNLSLSGILPFILLQLKQYVGFLCITITVLIFVLAVLIKYRYSVHISVITAILSYGFSCFAFVLSSFVIIPIGILLIRLNVPLTLRDDLSLLIIGILQLFLATIPFLSPRLKRGMPFLQQGSFGHTGTTISILILFLVSFLTSGLIGDINAIFCAVVILILGIILFTWWRTQLAFSYVLNQKKSEIADQTKKIFELEQKNTSLKENNESLARVIHKDNKLIPALELAVRELLSSTPFDSITTKTAVDMIQYLKILSRERTGLMANYSKINIYLPKSEIVAVDSMIHYMYHRAYSDNINLEVSLNCSIKHMVNTVISEDNLITLIADLLENALIATKEAHGKDVLLNIGIIHNLYSIEVFDSGVLFFPHIIKQLGLHPATSHSQHGGSGIGIMEIANFIRFYHASYIIDENIENSKFTKKVSFFFNNCSEWHIHSSRPEILSLRTERPDIIFSEH